MDAGVRQLIERRRVARVPAGGHGIVQARIRPGHEASIVNVGAHGALIETALRLLPERPIELQLETATDRSAVRARVLRCTVSRVLPASVSYRAAVRFDAPLPSLLAPTHHESAVLAAPALVDAQA